MGIMNYGLREKYEQLKKLGDRLSVMKKVIDWDRIIFLQSLYRMVDEAMEIELYSNIGFINFLDYPESVPDARPYGCFVRG